MEKPKVKPMTKTEHVMAKNIIIMLDKRAKKTKKNDAWFLPKEFVKFCEGMDITNHKARSYIKVLHLSGHLNREAVNRVANKYTLNPDSKEMMEIINSLIVKPIVKQSVSKNIPIGSILTEKEVAVALKIQEYIEFAKTLSHAAPAALGEDESFKAKNVINYLIRHSICKEQSARYYIRYLHGRGFLERVNRGVYKVTDSTKKPKKVIIKKVSKPSKEIKQAQLKCLRVTYGEKQMINKIIKLQDQIIDMNQNIAGIHMLISELTGKIEGKSLTLSNIFKRKMTPKTQIVKGG